jgi:hypothetical protein
VADEGGYRSLRQDWEGNPCRSEHDSEMQQECVITPCFAAIAHRYVSTIHSELAIAWYSAGPDAATVRRLSYAKGGNVLTTDQCSGDMLSARLAFFYAVVPQKSYLAEHRLQRY